MPLDLYYFNTTVPASTFQVSCFRERYGDWLKEFLCLPRRLKKKHRVSHKYPSSASEVQPMWKLYHKYHSSVVSDSHHKCISDICIYNTYNCQSRRLLYCKSITNSYRAFYFPMPKALILTPAVNTKFVLLMMKL